MIVFSGQMSEECKRYIIKQAKKSTFWQFIGLSLLGAIVTVAFAMSVHRAIIWFLVPFGLLPLISALPLTRKERELYIPSKITIYLDSGVISWQSPSKQYTCNAKDAWKVLDAGSWYGIFFGRKMSILCEKKLLTHGTIEEFEDFFSEILVKAEKK